MPQNNKIKRFPAVLSGLLFLSAGILKGIVPDENALQSVAFVYSNLVFFGMLNITLKTRTHIFISLVGFFKSKV